MTAISILTWCRRSTLVRSGQVAEVAGAHALPSVA